MSDAIEALLAEGRTFPPPDGFKRDALATDTGLYDWADQDYQGFWAQQAATLLDWYEEWHTILEWDLPFAKWFVGGKLNVSYNCLDRHVAAGHGDQVAYHWEGEPGDTRTITYAELLDDVCRMANALKSLGVQKGDRINIYMGMIPELAIAMLACARIGAAHSVVFGGFSSDALRDRIQDAQAKVLLTADGANRRGAQVALKQAGDVAIAECPTIEHVVVVRRTGQPVDMVAGRDHWYHDLVAEQSTECTPEPM
ncbi:MAG TPA: AMP-binding protein, partial [Acidimicrobiia bacterium]|nr:AMP-binding protein [Acidimicrobiia bacterium]